MEGGEARCSSNPGAVLAPAANQRVGYVPDVA